MWYSRERGFSDGYFDSWPMPLSHKIIMYICPKYKYKIEVPVEAVQEWEEEDM